MQNLQGHWHSGNHCYKENSVSLICVLINGPFYFFHRFALRLQAIEGPTSYKQFLKSVRVRRIVAHNYLSLLVVYLRSLQ